MTVATPTILSFSPDSGAVTGNPDVVDVSVLALAGTAAASTTVKIYNGVTLLGTAAVNASGQWTFTTPSLGSGLFQVSLTAVDTDSSGNVSAASGALALTVDTRTPSAPVILGVSPTTGAANALTTTSDQLTLSGDAAAGSIVTVYDGTSVLGTTTANAQGAWTYTTSPTLADGKQSFTATATSPAGATSALSAAVSATVTAGISSFSSITDQWHAPIMVGGSPYFVENANATGNAPWALTEINDHTLQFTLKPGDLWADNASNRTEIDGSAAFLPAKSTLNISYQLTVQPGVTDTSLSWLILGQLIPNTQDAIITPVTQDFAFHLTGADGFGAGDYLGVEAFYVLPGQSSATEVAATGNPYNGYLWVSPTPIVRGQAYDIKIQANVSNTSAGFLEIWLNGSEIVNYHGPLGYGGTNAWKEGVYEGWTTTQTITVDYANTVVSATPSAPVIATDTVNGNRVLLGGSAEANSTVSIYDGSTLLGTATAGNDGSWSYMTGALSTGAQSFTATAKDSAGNVSPASLASTATIVATASPVITAVTASAGSGEALVGSKITFNLAMSSAVLVSGVPRLTLSNGAVATYVSGSGSNTLTFQYTVAAGDANTAGLAVTGVSLPTGASISDANSNAAILTGALQNFSNITVDTTPVSAPVFVSETANANGSFTITGKAAPNTIVHEEQTVYTGSTALTLDGTAAVNASGVWTYTTPSLINGMWNTLSAYDTNSLGDRSATVTNNGGASSMSNLPSPVVLSNAVVNGAVTLSGVIPTNYGGTGPSGATVLVFDGSTQIGSATTTSGGNWTFTSGELTNGVHTFTVESKNASGVSAPSLPVSIAITQGLSGSVTVADFLSGKAALDAAGSFTISDTATAVASAIDAINADSHVSAVTLLGTPTLDLDVAQALGDTRALGVITNSNYGVAITDTGANVAASFDALNADSHITTILPTGGTQNLTLQLSQILNDTHALALLDPFVITVTGSAASLNALSSAQISAFAADGVTQLTASDADLTLTMAQRQTLGTGGISILQPFASGTSEILTYAADGTLANAVFQGVSGGAYTSYTVVYGTNGKPVSATYSNGMSATWTYNANGTYVVAFSGVTGQAFTTYAVTYGANGKPSSATYGNGLSETWTYNANGTYVTAVSGVTGQAFTSYATTYGADGKAVSETYSNGMSVTWTYNANGSYVTAVSGVSGQAFTSYAITYGANGKAASATYSNGLSETWTYNANGTYVTAVSGVTGQPFTSYATTYGADGKAVSETYSNGMSVTWTYNANGSYVTAVSGVTGQAFTSYAVTYGSNGKAASATYSNGLSETWTYNANGTYVTTVSGVTGQAFTSYAITYGANGKPVSETYSNGMSENWTYNANGTYSTAISGVTGQAFTSYATTYGANGKAVSATYNNGMSESWTYNADGSYDIALSGVTNTTYPSREIMYNAAGVSIGSAFESTSGQGVVTLNVGSLGVSSSSGVLSVKSGADTFSLTPHAVETISATGLGSETFSFGAGFGTDTIQGFVAGGTSGDALSLQLSMFKGLSSANTALQNVNILLSGNQMTQSGANVNITDTSGDELTLAGMTVSTLTQYASSAFKFV
jgi:hypothetical protein